MELDRNETGGHHQQGCRQAGSQATSQASSRGEPQAGSQATSQVEEDPRAVTPDDGARSALHVGAGPISPNVLYPAEPPGHAPLVTEAPAYFVDLNLDQMVASLTEGLDEYELAPDFYGRIHDIATIKYRQAVFLDLERSELSRPVLEFAQRMRDIRALLARTGKLHNRHQQERWIVEASDRYSMAVQDLRQHMTKARPHSAGLLGIARYLSTYVESTHFRALRSDSDQVHESLRSVHYTVRIKGSRISVTRYNGEPDYSEEVLAAFERFARSKVSEHRGNFPEPLEMNRVESRVVDLVARIFPEVFEKLRSFAETHHDFVDPVIGRFERDMQFYLAYLGYLRPMRDLRLPFCYPEVIANPKEVTARDAFDVVLAANLASHGKAAVCNSFSLTGSERILVVSGPNQGGKTTFARMVGQIHHLATLGCPVPGSSARIHLLDQLFTHFERPENLADMRGKLEDDLLRIRRILTCATGNSLVVLNELFSSTTLDDALFLGKLVMERLVELDVLGVFVTFLDELASYSLQTVSMVSTVQPDDPATRTYQIVHRDADGLAYALAIADKYGLTYEALRRRLRSSGLS